MFWIFLLLSLLGAGLVKLGAMSVWLAVFKMAFFAVGTLCCFLVALGLWRKVR